MARPSIFTEELANKICERLSNGESLLKICEDDEMPDRTTVHRWLLEKDKKEFYNKYEEAINIRTENMFDELNNIADISDKQESAQRSRLRVDTRKWYLSKVMPKKYGDKLDLTTDGEKLPTPIIPLTNVQRNDSNEEDNSPEEED